MKLSLSPVEVLHVLQSVHHFPMQDQKHQRNLVESIQNALLTVLEKEEQRLQSEAYKNWSLQEKKKLEALNENLKDLGIGKTVIKTARRK